MNPTFHVHRHSKPGQANLKTEPYQISSRYLHSLRHVGVLMFGLGLGSGFKSKRVGVGLAQPCFNPSGFLRPRGLTLPQAPRTMCCFVHPDLGACLPSTQQLATLNAKQSSLFAREDIPDGHALWALVLCVLTLNREQVHHEFSFTTGDRT